MDAAGMLMPETSVNKNHGLVFRQHNVWLSGELPGLEPKSEPVAMKKRADADLRSRIRRADPTHDFTSLLRRDGVSHRKRLIAQRVNRRRQKKQ